ncbi:MAG: PEPxxWA-CTERM sorting domain-containing protein [Caulobacteraceae bacterium]
MADIGFTFDTSTFNSLTKVDNLNGSTTLNFGVPLSGITYFGIHYGAGVGGPGNGTAFYELDLTSPTNTITLNYNASSDAVLYETGTAVPEPATWALLIGGFAFAGGLLRGSRKRLATA